MISARSFSSSIVSNSLSFIRTLPPTIVVFTSELLAEYTSAANSSDVNTTIVGGKVLMKDKELLTIDEEKLRAEITKAQEYFSN